MLLTYQVIFTLQNSPQQIIDMQLSNELSEAEFLFTALCYLSKLDREQLVKISLCVYTGGSGYFVLPKWVDAENYTGKYYFGVSEK